MQYKPMNDKVLRLLTIEDDATLRRCFVQYLSDRGFEVLEAANGEQGVELFRRYRPDGVLLDFRMPGLSGMEVLKILASEAPNTPVIVVSGTGSLQQATGAMRQGAWDYLVKPIFDLAQLEQAMRSALERAESRRKSLEYQEHLEAEVQARTRELQAEVEERKRAVAELQSAKNAAEAASAAKSQFLANMSHELRTPLNAIIGVAQLLRKTNPSLEQAHFLDLILDSSTDLLHIVSDLLDLSTIQAERLQIKEKDFSLRGALEPVIANAGRRARDKGLSFKEYFDPTLPQHVRGDAMRIRQALLNVLDNALQFTERGEVGVSVTLAVQDKDRAHYTVLFQVSDTGIGIPRDKLETIFDSFTLGEDYMTKKYGGSGLGLAITKELVGRMGGEVWVESEPGEGSSFFFTVRVARAEAAQAETAGAIAALQRPATPQGVRPAAAQTGLRILLVEDEPVSRLFTKRMLHVAGHDVLLAEDGLKALEVLSSKPVDLVLMDLQLPRLNGLDAVKAIRRSEVPGVAPDIPIIALTAFARTQDRERGLEAGVDDYVIKPFEADELFVSLERVMAGPRNGRHGQSAAPLPDEAGQNERLRA